MKHLDKVKVFKVVHCWVCTQHFVVDENNVMFTLDENVSNVDNGYYDIECPKCEAKIRVFAKEYFDLPYVVKSEE